MMERGEPTQTAHGNTYSQIYHVNKSPVRLSTSLECILNSVQWQNIVRFFTENISYNTGGLFSLFSQNFLCLQDTQANMANNLCFLRC